MYTSTIENQLTALITLMLAKEAHDTGMIDDESYKKMLSSFSDELAEFQTKRADIFGFASCYSSSKPRG